MLISAVGWLALGLGAVDGAAWADEAYVCDGGRIVYVRFGQLEAMKHNDPCIAAYHPAKGAGGTIGGAAKVAGAAAGPAPTVKAASSPAAAVTGSLGRKGARIGPPPVPHPDTDFRNVRLLNAAPGENPVYHHTR